MKYLLEVIFFYTYIVYIVTLKCMNTRYILQA